ncbi:MAG: CvpA family protein [Anaerolineae bacterium]|jgi:uncharacterized membrane protein required for colicin V production
MISIVGFFGIVIGFFGIIGLMRGWTKEIIATAGIVLALFALSTLEETNTIGSFIPQNATSAQQFGIRAGLFILIVFFSYQTPAVAETVSRGKLTAKARAAIQERILGLIIGLVNGYLIAGTIWYYLRMQGYPFPNVLYPPLNPDTGQPDPAMWDTITFATKYLPLDWISPWLPYLMILLFLFVIIAII